MGQPMGKPTDRATSLVHGQESTGGSDDAGGG